MSRSPGQARWDHLQLFPLPPPPHSIQRSVPPIKWVSSPTTRHQATTIQFNHCLLCGHLLLFSLCFSRLSSSRSIVVSKNQI